MNDTLSQIKRVKAPAVRSGERKTVLESVLKDILATKEARHAIIDFVPLLLETWSGDSKIKTQVSKITGSIVKNQLSRPEDLLDKNEIKTLFEDENFVNNLTCLLPGLVNDLTDALSGINLGKNGAAKDLLHTLLTETGQGRTGSVLTSLARLVSHIHKTDPHFFTTTLEPGIQKWIASVDFAELKEAADRSGPDALAFVEMVNTVIWQYPSKVIGIFSLLPSLINILAGSLNISLEKLNAVPPDLLTDIITSLLEEISAEEVGSVINELAEISRKLHTGSALLGEPGAPQLENALADKLEDIIAQVEPRIFWKGKLSLARLKASVDEAITGATANDSELLQLAMTNSPELANIRVRARNKHLSALENQDDAAFDSLMNFRLSALDTQEAAEQINTIVRLANRLWDQNPDICSEFIRQFVNGLDEDELAYTVSSFFSNLGEDLKPVARTFLPGVVAWGCDVLAPRDDEHEEQAQQARNALKALLETEEVRG